MPVEDAFLNNLHLEPIACGVNDCRPNTAADALARNQQCVDAKIVELRHQRRSEKGAWCRLTQKDLARQRRDLIDDVEATLPALAYREITRYLPVASRMKRLEPARDPCILFPEARNMDHRDTHCSRLRHQALNIWHSLPRGRTAITWPLLDTLQERHILVAKDSAIEINIDHCRPMTGADRAL